MKNKTKKVLSLSLFSVCTVGAVAAFTTKGFTFGGVRAANGGTWKHYAQKLPGAITGTKNGVREYWVECGGDYQFTKPDGVTIVEGTDYNVSEFATNDARFIIPLEGEYRTVFLNSSGYRYASETPEIEGEGWWYSGTLADVGVSQKMLWKQTKAELKDTTPYYYVDTVVATKVIKNWNEFKETFYSGGGTTYTSGTKVEGYYVLGADIAVTGNINHGVYTSALYDAGFVGVLDGRGRTFNASTVGSYNGGTFGLLNGATIKNMKMIVPCANYEGSVIGNQANDCIFKNLDITIPTAASDNAGRGRIVGRFSQDNLWEDITIKVGASQTLSTVFGANTNGSNTFIKVTYQQDAKPANWVSTNGGVDNIGEVQGLSYIPDPAVVVDGWQDIEAKADAQTLKVPAIEGNIESITLTDRLGTVHALGTDPAAIVLPTALINETQAHGENVVVITTSTKVYAIRVTLVTKYLADKNDMAVVRGFNLGTKVYGYYAMKNDIAVDYTATGIGESKGTGWSTTANGFYGVFDGRGYAIKGNLFTAKCGIFGTMQGAAICQNLNIYNDNFTGWGNVVFGIGCMGADAKSMIRFANVDVNIKTSGSASDRTGILFGSGLNTIAFQNMQVTIRGTFEAANTVSLFPANYLTATTRLNHFVWNTPQAATLSLIAGKTGINPGLTLNITE